LNDFDLSYTPPLSSPWDALQTAAQAWIRDATQPALRATTMSNPREPTRLT